MRDGGQESATMPNLFLNMAVGIDNLKRVHRFTLFPCRIEGQVSFVNSLDITVGLATLDVLLELQ